MIKLGIIGYSEGNGHPFSWSAIFNGYDIVEMQTCGYPVIPDYLNKKKYPTEYLCQFANVDGIWTQKRSQSEKIAKSALIPNVYDDLSELVSSVDAVLLARDDSENHLHFLDVISKYDKPVYIDKPIATDEISLNKIINLFSDNSKFFSCSAFRFHPKIEALARRIQLNPKNIKITGKIPKSWQKYSVHLLDPMVELLPNGLELIDFERTYCEESGITVDYKFENQISASITTTGFDKGDIDFCIEFEDHICKIDFNDTFTLFKSALLYFIINYVQNSSKKDIFRYKKLVKLIACGLR